MTNAETRPCARALDADCYKAHPAWARRAFAYRLIHLLAPAEITRRLPKLLRLALIAPDVVIPPGVDIPDGTAVNPGTDVPPDYQPPDPTPPGIIIPPGTEFPPGWTPGDPLPPGVASLPGADFPPGWSPGTGPVDGILQPPETPDGAQDTGVTPPTYIPPGGPGPTRPPPQTYPKPASYKVYATTNDGWIRNGHSTWQLAHDATEGDTYGKTKAEHASPILSYNAEPTYGMIRRTFFTFDLSDIPTTRTVTGAVLWIRGYDTATADVCVQASTHSEPFVLDDYDSFFGPPFDMITWTLATNSLNLDANGIKYIQDSLGDLAKFCLREYDHDYLDACPPAMQMNQAGMYFMEALDEDNRPYLVVWCS